MKFLKYFISSMLIINLFIASSVTNVFAAETQLPEKQTFILESSNDMLEPGWIQVGLGRWENPSTGEFFQINNVKPLAPSMYNSDASLLKAPAYTEDLSFSFKIRFHFKCPTKFKASSSSASVNTSVYTESESEKVEAPDVNGFKYGVEVGSKTIKLVGGEVTDGTVKVKEGRKYSVKVYTRQPLPAYTYLLGDVDVN